MVSSCFGCPDCCTFAESFDSVGCEVTSKTYVNDAKTEFGNDSGATVCLMFGVLGVDSVNTTNESVSCVAWPGCKCAS